MTSRAIREHARSDDLCRRRQRRSRCSRIWQLPRSYGDLVARRRALQAWCELHAGFLGRSPDHVASTIAGMYMGLDAFAEYDRGRAAALADYYRFARDHDLYLTYVIINPQADRSKAAHQQGSEHLTAAVVDEDAGGLTVHGAKMLATAAIMANEILVTSIQPLQPGDENYAVSFAVPLATPGLKVLSRKSYEQSAGSVFDNPFAARFDENDAVIYFDQRAGAVGAGVRRPRHRHVPETVSRHAGAHLPELPGADPAAREVAFPGRGGAPHRGDQRHSGVPAGARYARRAGRRGGHGRGHGGGDGGARRHGGRVLRAAPAHVVRRAGDHPEAVRQGDHQPEGVGRRRADHAAVERARLQPTRSWRR